MTDFDSPILTDLYQLNMMAAYEASGANETATFEFFFRALPERRGFLLAVGLEQALDFLEGARFTGDDIAWLRSTGRFEPAFLDRLADFKFTGEVWAVPEGTAVFADEPVLRVTAPLPQAQLVETRLINLLHYQTLVASKAARMVLAAPGKTLIDFGLRRAHGGEAGLLAARASYLAGFDATATVLAGKRWGLPLSGTMAHAFIQAFDDEAEAFAAFALAQPDNAVLLIDSYDTLAAAHKIVTLAPRLAAQGVKVRGVRIDSGDLVALARGVRAIFDSAGLADIAIFVSGGLDEDDLLTFARQGAPIDGYGLGTSLTTSSDVPSLDCAYKLEEYAGVARRKRSAGKATWPGRKQVWRTYGESRMTGDVIGLEDEARDGEPMLAPVMRAGARLGPSPPLDEIRHRARAQLVALPEPLRRLEPGAPYPVVVSESLRRLADDVDRRLSRMEVRS